MSIPFISNVALTEVNSSGTLNDKAGTTKSKLPIQIFKLTDNITGNLTLNNSTAHKKIILDTNAKTIINSTGSPLTTNSSTTLELKGSGNIQSTLKTFNSTVTNTSNSGVTTISEADNSTVNVQTDTYEFDTLLVNDTRSAGGGPSFTDFNTTVRRPQDSGSSSRKANPSYYSTNYGTKFGGPALTNINRSDFGMSFTHAFLEDGTPISGRISGPSSPGGTGGTSTFDGGTSKRPSTNTTYSVSGVTYRYMYFSGALVGVNNGNSGTFDIAIYIDVNTQKLVVEIIGGRGAFNQIKSVSVTGPTPGRRFIFTNNLSQPCVLSGANPYDSVTVNAGATAQSDRNSEDGSFNITGTISGSDGSGQPFALKPVNDGSGTTNTSAYSGTLSASAL